MSLKHCRKCNEDKPISSFNRSKNCKDGLYYWCKECVKDYTNKLDAANPERTKASRDKYYSKNKEKIAENSKRYKAKNPEKCNGKYNSENYWSYRIKTLYGISNDQYYELLTHQDNKCAVCKVDSSELTKRLSVDHDHSKKRSDEGFVRGLLCNGCNLALGMAHNKPETLRNLAGYLVKGKQNERR